MFVKANKFGSLKFILFKQLMVFSVNKQKCLYNIFLIVGKCCKLCLKKFPFLTEISRTFQYKIKKFTYNKRKEFDNDNNNMYK
uniref:Uncharacterized protein n=1 Tax=Strongyloides papillosus TaxID=174720 RepID=A0A0N5CEV4_STREA